jgi:glycosyltransferase involved in cell wall biosynthesis
MHIVFLTRRYWPAVGGVEKHLEGVIEALGELRKDFQFTVITEKHHADLPESEMHLGVQILRLLLLPAKNPNIKKSIWDGMTKHLKVLQSADVIHVHDVFFWLLPFLPRLFNKKIFITFHGYEPPGPPNWRQRFWHQYAELFSDGNICIGGFHQKWYGVEPTQISFGAVDSIKEKSPAKHTQNKFVFVGRLEEDTGIWAYLQAFSQYVKKYPNDQHALDIAGDGPLRMQLEQFVRDEKLPVHFLGQIKVSPNFYTGYQASFVSGYLTILESLAAGIPVISTYSTQLKKDYLSNTPFAEWIDVAAPGEELLAAMTNHHQLDHQGRDWANEQSWTVLAKQYLQLWETL